MRRLKRNIGLVLALLVFLTVVKPVPVRAAAKGSDISAGDLPGSQIYATISGNNYGICIMGGLKGEFTVPEKYDGKTINTIEIRDCDGLTGVTAGENIKNLIIRNCDSVNTLTLPASLEEITIDSCHALGKVTIDKNNKKLASVYNSVYSKDYRTLYYYAGIDDTEINIQEGLYEIGFYAFNSCNNVTKITIPASVYDIGEFAFCGLDKLKTIEVADGNLKYSIHNGDLYCNSTLMRCLQSGRIKLWEGTKYIQKEAFDECRDVESIDMPDISGCKAVKAGEVCDVSWTRGRQYNFFLISDKQQFYTVSKEDENYFILYDGSTQTDSEIQNVSRLIPKGRVRYFGVQPVEDRYDSRVTVSFDVSPVVRLNEKQSVNINDVPGALYEFTPDATGNYIMRYDYYGDYTVYDEQLNKLYEDGAACNLDLYDTMCYGKTYRFTAGRKYYFFIGEYTSVNNIMVAHDDKVEKISVCNAPDREYYIGETKIALTGLRIRVLFEDGTTREFTYDRSWDCYRDDTDHKRAIYVEWYSDTIKEEANYVDIVCYGERISYEVPVVSHTIIKSGCWRYYESYGNTAEIAGCDVQNDTIEIPEMIDGRKVTSISRDAFIDNHKIRRVILPESIERINMYAFSGCDKLKEINFPAGLDTIDSEAFSGCALTEVTLPENVFCGMSVFKNCTSLRKVTLPEGMTEIPDEMFMGCVSLKHINIPASVREVTSGTFAYCKSLTDIDVQSDIFTYKGGSLYLKSESGDWLIMYNPAATTIDISNGSRIGRYALTSVGYTQDIHFPADHPGFDEVKLNVPYKGAYGVYGEDNEILFRAPHTGIYRIHMECDRDDELYDYDPVTPLFIDESTGDGYIYLDKNELYVIEHYIRCQDKEKIPFTVTVTDVSEGVFRDKLRYRVTEDSLVFYGFGSIRDGLPEIFNKASKIVFENGTGGISGDMHLDKSRLKELEFGGVSSQYISITDFDPYSENYTERKDEITLRGPVGGNAESYATENGLNFSPTDKINIHDADVKAKYVYYIESGVVHPDISITYNNKKLIENVDYTVDDIDTSSMTGYYHLCAYGIGNYMGEIGFPVIIQPKDPILKAAENTAKGINVRWNPVGQATGYIIYRKSPGKSWKRICVTDSGQTTQFLDTAVTNGVTYTYTARAMYGKITGDWSSTAVITRLGYPEVKSLSNITSGIEVKWSRTAGAGGYILYRKTSGGTYARIANIKHGNVTSYIDRTAKAGISYTYTVRAYSGTSMSGWRNPGTILRLADPTVQSALNATGGTQIKWSRSAGAGGYIVYRRNKGGTWKRIAYINGQNVLSYTDKSAKAGVTYDYTVRAFKGSLLSDWHNYKTIRRLNNPTLKSVTTSRYGINIRWNKSPYATGYIIYRKTGKGSWTRIAKINNASATGFTDTTAAKGVKYTYTIRSYSGSYLSYWNSVRSAVR